MNKHLQEVWALAKGRGNADEGRLFIYSGIQGWFFPKLGFISWGGMGFQIEAAPEKMLKAILK